MKRYLGRAYSSTWSIAGPLKTIDLQFWGQIGTCPDSWAFLLHSCRLWPLMHPDSYLCVCRPLTRVSDMGNWATQVLEKCRLLFQICMIWDEIFKLSTSYSSLLKLEIILLTEASVRISEVTKNFYQVILPPPPLLLLLLLLLHQQRQPKFAECCMCSRYFWIIF